MKANFYLELTKLRPNKVGKYLILTALSLCLNIDARSQSPRIFGGQPVTIDEVPWQVSLENANGDHFCGGSIVHESWIVTAAHCVNNVGTITVHAGATDQTNNAVGQRIAVDQIIIHDDFNVGTEIIDNDIALLHLQTPLTFNADVQPICVTDGILPIPVGTVAIISGWGDTGAGCCSDELMMAQVPVISDANANNLINNNNNACDPNNEDAVGPSTIAFFQQGIAAGMGDSGGPAVVVIGGIPVLVGTSSWGGCPRDDFPTMYGDVSELSQFVFENALDLDQCPCLPPIVALNSVTISCPVDENLSPLVTSTLPTGSILVWSTDDNLGDGVSPPIVGNVNSTGTYFGYYYNAESGCYSPPSEGVVVEGAQSQDINITANTSYSTDMEIFGDIYVKNGATLTITSTLTLNTGGVIYIEDDSRLIVDGGTLTACGESWQGVKVAGQFDLGSLIPTGAIDLARGFVELKNGAVIEKAIIGIDARDVYISGSGLLIYHGGGKITIASGSGIQDCGIGVRLNRYGWGSLIGAGPSGPGYPIGYEDEPSVFSNSFFRNCDVAIYSDLNIGLSIINTVFGGNYTDYEGYLSSVTATGNEFSSLVFIASEHPVIPGSNFTNNKFTDGWLAFEGQGNITRHNLKQNTATASSFHLTGELIYGINENEFSNGGNVGLFMESTGESIENWVIDNSFSGQWSAISVFGENDTEYLANCFSGTSHADIEINAGASIHVLQGTQQSSAGNCFYYSGRIKTGNGISPFTYWSKDGYDDQCHPFSNCKYPGACNGFTLSQSQEETEIDCETNIIGDPPSELNCECGSGLSGCTDAIASVRSSIAGLGSSEGDDILEAQYRRCLDKLIRTFVDTTLASGQVEDCIDFLSAQPEFRYRAMAYGIMAHNLKYEQASDFLDTLQTSKSEEQDFVDVQKIWLDYIMNIDSFMLSSTDSMKLRTAGEAFNPLAGYARTVFYKLTGERITRDFIHTDSTVTPRSSNEMIPADESQLKAQLLVWPNPVTGQNVDISLENVDINKEYVLVVYDAIGTLVSKVIVSNNLSSISVSNSPGLYFISLLQDGEWIQTKKVVRN